MIWTSSDSPGYSPNSLPRLQRHKDVLWKLLKRLSFAMNARLNIDNDRTRALPWEDYSRFSLSLPSPTPKPSYISSAHPLGWTDKNPYRTLSSGSFLTFPKIIPNVFSWLHSKKNCKKIPLWIEYLSKECLTPQTCSVWRISELSYECLM